MDTLGKRIKYLRERLKFDQAEFAKYLGLESAAAISKYESDQREPDKDKLVKIGKLADVSLDWLLTGEGPMERKKKEEQPQATEKYRAGESAAPRVQERTAQYRREEDMDPKLAILLQKVKLVYTRGDDKQRATLRGIIEEVFDEISKREREGPS